MAKKANGHADAPEVSLPTRLATLFRGLMRAYGTYALDDKKQTKKTSNGERKVVGKAVTVQGPVTDELWENHLKGLQGLGIVPINEENKCFFGAIDIDQYDIKLEDIENKVKDLRLSLLPTRTKSGGCHLYFFASEPTPADLVRRKLEEWSAALGYGGAEIFPKQTTLLSKADTGNWINMPYFAALSESGKTERYGIFKGVPLSLKEFCTRAEKLAMTIKDLEAEEVPSSAEFLEGPPCLQSLSVVGFTKGMRNDSLFAIAVYLKKRFPDDWQTHMHLYNIKHIKPPLSDGELKVVTKSVSRKDYNYACDRAPCKNYCNRSLCKTRKFGVGADSEDWSIVIEKDALCVMTDPPYWIVTVNGVRIELTADEIQSQHFFVKKCIEKIRHHPSKISEKQWRTEMNKMLESATPVEAPEDASVTGELREHLRQFCTVFTQAETKEEILTGKPYTDMDDKETIFRGADFRAYLESKHFKALTGSRLFAALRAYGVRHKQYWVAEQNIHVWCIPSFNNPVVDIKARTIVEEGGM